MKKSSIEAFNKLIEEKEQILISMHRNPDGDALGSSLALAAYLEKLGKKVHVMAPNHFPSFLNWMPGAKNCTLYEANPEHENKRIDSSDLLICLDFNDINRLGKMAERVEASNIPIIAIDHHRDPSDFADLMISDATSCATAQMVFQLIEGRGHAELIDRDIAACLYAGIMTDTGSFRFSSTSAETHRIAAILLETGLEHWTIHEKIMDQNTEMRMKLMGYAINEKMQVLNDHHTCIMHLTQEELKAFNFKKGDTEGFVNLALSIVGTVFAAFFVESEEGYIKISFRSKGQFPTNDVARDHFNGGGHLNAAGGRSDLSMEQTIEKFIRLLPEYAPQLKENYALI